MKLPEAVQDKLIDIGEMVLRRSNLKAEAKALIAISASVACRCTHCHGEFKKMAKKLGVVEKEIDEAIEIAVRMRQRCENEGGLYRLKG
ncbi:MAG: hypothetical protein GXP25_13425 [Planctomycetes bacterium]|nr:hypothetical protein [Planctomycetota bacterium]